MLPMLIDRLPKLRSLLILLTLCGCGASAEEKKSDHLERADQFFEEKKYQEAIIEYLNVLQVEPENQPATRSLGLALIEIGQFGRALRFLQKAQRTDPDDLEVGLKLASVYLLGGRREEAKGEINHILERNPNDFDALQLLVEVASSPQEIDHVFVELERLRSQLEDRARFHFALAKLYIKRGDIERAEGAFRQAAEKNPDSIDAHLGLGAIYAAKGDHVRAEEEFKSAAEMAPPMSPAKISLVNYYLAIGKRDEAKAILHEVTEETPDHLLAWRRLAQIAVQERRFDDAAKALDEILELSPQDVDALQGRGELHIAKGEFEPAEARFREAISLLREVIKLRPDFTAVRYRLAQLHIYVDELEQAKSELTAILKLNPNIPQAVLLLSRLNLRTGDVDSVIQDLEALVEKQPELKQAHDLLGIAYLTKQDPAKAAEALAKAVDLVPNDARQRYLLGASLLGQGKWDEARRQLEAALSLSPAYIDPLNQIVSLELSRKNPDAAIARIQKQIEEAPDSGAHQQLLGIVYHQKGDQDAAESTFLKAVDLDPSLANSYAHLADIYVESGRIDQAIAQTDEALGTDPDNQGLLMLAGRLHQIKGDNAKAIQAYEKLLILNPSLASAANNLAYIYAEREDTLEKALQFAEIARKAAPQNPEIADTLAWILYKRGTHQRALSLLKESVSALPENAEVQYHLGMVYYKLDDKEAAWLSLNRAFELADEFPGADEARTALEELEKLQ